MIDHWCLRNAIYGNSDGVAHIVGLDFDVSVRWIQDGWHRQECLQSISLGPAVGRRVGFSAGSASGEIADVGDHLLRKPWPVVLDADAILRDRDLYLRRYARVFAGIEGVVDQFLHGNQRPKVPGMANLGRQLLLT